jgi:protein-S-isoprenylcysteine O-methyltransferase Ste14
MPHSNDMHYRNTFFYVLTQIIGITALLGWLAYGFQHSGPSPHVALPDIANPLAGGSWRQAISYLLDSQVTLPVLILINGALALRSRRDNAPKSVQATFGALFLLLLLAFVTLLALRHNVIAPHPALSGQPDLVEHSIFGVYFLLFELYFAGWALNHQRLRWLGLGMALATGAALCLLQSLEGAHYLSDTLWAASIAWLLCSVLFFYLVVGRRTRAGSDRRDYTLDEIWKHLSTVQVQRRRTLAIYGVLLVCLIPFVASQAPAESPPHETVEWIGLGLIFLAIIGRCWCMLYLGGRKGAELIDQGPYSISRNPLYWFSMIAVAGIGAQSGSLLLGPLLALFVYAVFNNVIDEEERLLRKVFGAQFEAYCAKVPRFGPRLSNWNSADNVTVSVSGLWGTLRDALPYFLAVPVFELVEWAQVSGWLPVLIRLP